jgi:hypothetical protein
MELSFANVNGSAMVVSEKVHFHEIAVILDIRSEGPRKISPRRSGSPHLFHKNRPGQDLL